MNKDNLYKIIREVIEDYFAEGGDGSGRKFTKTQLRDRERKRKQRDDAKRRRENALGSEFIKLSKGIAEDGEQVQCSDGNPFHHPETGEWSSEEDAGSWSIRAKGTKCRRGQKEKSYKGKSNEPCGRGEPIRCKDGTKK